MEKEHSNTLAGANIMGIGIMVKEILGIHTLRDGNKYVGKHKNGLRNCLEN